MPFAVTFASKITTLQTFTGDDVVGSNSVNHSGYDDAKSLDGSTAVDVDTAAYETLAMTAGAATIDLTAVLLNLAAVTFLNKKARFLKIKALPANANNVTVSKGASNGYDGMGALVVTLEPGQSFLFDFADKGNVVDATHKTLDLAGTGTQGVQLSLVGGAT